MSRVYDLLVRARGDASQAEASMRGLQRSIETFGKNTRKIGLGMTAAISLPLLALGKLGADELAQIQTANQQTTAAIERMGSASRVTVGEVAGLARALQKKSGIDDQAIQSAANYVLTLGSINTATKRGESVFRDATRTAVNMAEALNMDVGAAGKQVAKTMAAAAQGVLLLPRGMKLTALETKNVKAALEEASSATERQSVVMGVLNGKFADSAKVTDAEKIELFKDQLAGVSAELLSDLIPTLSRFLGGASNLLDKFERLDAGTRHTVASLALFSFAAGPVLAAFGQIASGASAIVPVLAGVGRGVGAIALAAGSAIPALSTFSLVIAANPLLAGTLAIGAIIAAGVAVAKFGGDTRKSGDDARYAKEQLRAYQDAMDQMSGALVSARQAASRVRDARQTLAQATRAVADAESEHGRKSAQYRSAVQAKSDAVTALDAALNDQARAQRDAADATEEAGRKAKKAGADYEKATDDVDRATKALKHLRAEAGTDAYDSKSVKLWESRLEDATAAQERAAKKLRNLRDQFPQLQRAIGPAKVELSDLRKEIERLPTKKIVSIVVKTTTSGGGGSGGGGGGGGAFGWDPRSKRGDGKKRGRGALGSYMGTGFNALGDIVAGGLSNAAAVRGSRLINQLGSDAAYTITTDDAGFATVTENDAVTTFLTARKKANAALLQQANAKRTRLLKKLKVARRALAKANAALGVAKRNGTKADKQAAQTKVANARSTVGSLEGEIEGVEQEIASLGGQINADTAALEAPDVTDQNETADGAAKTKKEQDERDAENFRRRALGLASVEEDAELEAANKIRAQYGLAPVKSMSEIGSASSSSTTDASLTQQSISGQGVQLQSQSTLRAIADSVARALAGAGVNMNVNTTDPDAIVRRLLFVTQSSATRAGGVLA